jgi:hypothetical protein
MNVLQIVLFLSLIWNFNDTIVQLENVGATSAQFAAKPRCVHLWPNVFLGHRVVCGGKGQILPAKGTKEP